MVNMTQLVGFEGSSRGGWVESGLCPRFPFGVFTNHKGGTNVVAVDSSARSDSSLGPIRKLRPVSTKKLKSKDPFPNSLLVLSRECGNDPYKPSPMVTLRESLARTRSFLASLFYHDQSHPLSGGLNGNSRHFLTLITPRTRQNNDPRASNSHVTAIKQRHPSTGCSELRWSDLLDGRLPTSGGLSNYRARAGWLVLFLELVPGVFAVAKKIPKGKPKTHTQ